MPIRRVGLLVALLPLLLLAPATPASAHDTLLGSRPDAGAVVASAPTSVELLFAAEVAPYAPTIVVTSPSGSTVQSGPAQVNGTRVTQPLEALRELGEYVVAYRVVSGDGHPVTGTFSFFYGTTPSAQPGTSTDSATASGTTAVILGLAALAFAAVVLGAVVVLRRRRPPRPE